MLGDTTMTIVFAFIWWAPLGHTTPNFQLVAGAETMDSGSDGSDIDDGVPKWSIPSNPYGAAAQVRGALECVVLL